MSSSSSTASTATQAAPRSKPTSAEVRKRLEILTSKPVLGVNIPGTFSFGANGDLLVFLDSDPAYGEFRFLACINTTTLARRDLLKPEEGDTEENLSLEEKLRRERQRAQAVGVTSFSWCGSRGLMIPLQGGLYLLNPRDAQPTLNLVLAKGELPTIDARAAHGGNRIAFVRGGDLFAMNYDETTRAFSSPVLMSYPPTNNTSGMTNGLASFLAQEEMDRQHGYWWSPDGKLIAYERVDEREIPEYVIVHQCDKVQEEQHRYPFAGCANPLTYLCLTNAEARFAGNVKDECTILDLTMSQGEKDVYLGRVDWYSPTELFVQVMNRGQDRLELILFNVSDPAHPKKRLLITEFSKFWINLHDLFETLKHKNHFLWGSERTGFQHLYLYRFDPELDHSPAELVRTVTAGKFVVEAVVGLDEDEDLVYFMANADAPTERHLYVTRLYNEEHDHSMEREPDNTKGCSMIRLTDRGTGYVTFDSQCRRFVLNHSTLCQPPRVTLEGLPSAKEIRDRLAKHEQPQVENGKGTPSPKRLRGAPTDVANVTEMITFLSLAQDVSSVKFLVEAPEEEHIPQLHTKSLHTIAGLKDYSLLPPLVNIPPAMLRFAVEDHALFAQVYIPQDKSKHGNGPYPTIVFVYGGPHVQRVKNEWYGTVDLRAQALADLGYMVVKCDNRGSSRRGLDFESAIYRKMGGVELEDQIACLRVLAARGLCDITRVGITGWSYGGYMTAMALAKHPEVFKVGVSGAPVTNWDGYDTAYTERYMGTPQNNPDGYADGSVMTHVRRMEGKLLLVHGMVDENVHFRHTARLIDALIQNQKPHDLLILPDERHGPRKPQSRLYLENRTVQYFIDNL